jgi:hypothetical protein
MKYVSFCSVAVIGRICRSIGVQKRLLLLSSEYDYTFSRTANINVCCCCLLNMATHLVELPT